MGIAVCGSGLGTAAFAPINRILLENYYWTGAFLIKGAIILNIFVCAFLMVPLPIEPSEILKRKRKLEKKLEMSNEHAHSKDIKLNVLEAPQDKNLSPEEEETKLEQTEKLREENELLKSYSSLNFLATIQGSKKNLNEIEKTGEVKTALIENQEENKESKAFDPRILLNILFLIFAISNFLTSLGFNAPYIYINDQAILHGISKTNADLLLQAIGASNTIGRIVLGFLGDLKQFNRLYLYSTVITICGIATLIEPFLTTFPLLLIYAIVFGFTSG